MSKAMTTCGECSKFWTMKGLCWGKCLRNLSTRHIAFEACSDFTPRCPLPRVGSKDWDWDIHGRLVVPELGYEYEIKEYSPQQIQATVVGERGLYFRTIGTWLLDLDIARSLCELHARREWMRKNRARKG